MKLVLVHGLLGSRWQMRPLASRLEKEGHEVHRIGYGTAGRTYQAVLESVARELHRLGFAQGGSDLGFVAHSLGGLLWRDLPRVLPGFSCGRSVLIGSPLGGSIVARRVGRFPFAHRIWGEAIGELGNPSGGSVFPGPFATVAGTRWGPWIPAAHLMRRVAPGEPSDSTVRIEEVRSPAAQAHREFDRTHTFLLVEPRVFRFVCEFLRAD